MPRRTWNVWTARFWTRNRRGPRRSRRSVNFENRQSRNETAQAKAELAVELADLALQQYEDEHGGTYQIELQDVELSIQEQEAQKEIDDRNLIGHAAACSTWGTRARGIWPRPS